MKIVEIWKDERYPDYGVSDRKEANSFTTEITDEFYDRLRKVEKEYEAIQKELRLLYGERR